VVRAHQDSRLKALLQPTALVLALMLAGCVVGPDHVRPSTQTDAHFLRDETVGPGATAPAPAAVIAAADEGAFWQRFDDPLLARLVDDALAANHDLRIALARLDQARALARQSRFDLLPTVTAEAGTSSLRASSDQAGGADRDTDSHAAGVRIGWELDLFGRVRRGVQAQQAESAAAQADLAAVQVAVAADVAQAYFDLRGRQAQLAVARGNALNQQRSLDIVAVRLEAGRGTELDTSRASAQLESTRARIPALEAEIAATMHRLAVLTGRQPQALVGELETAQALPELSAPVAAGTPGDLLRRRPDIAAAEHRLEAATARVGIATADLFPRFSLGALLGSQAGDASGLFGGDSESGFVALGIDWTFLDAGRVRARIAASEAGADEQLARYEQTVLLALEETETALVRYHHARSEAQHLETAATAGATASELARVRFEGGLVDFLQVLDAERAQLDAEDQLAQARTRNATALVAVYRALAGGWPDLVRS
jgi:multidrug efflux system outer membrane protein